MYQYGNIEAAFHGKAEDLRKLAPLVGDEPELEELKEQLQVDPELAPETETTVIVRFFSEGLDKELPCIDALANQFPCIEIAVAAAIADSITDMEGRYSAFYPLGRTICEEADYRYEFFDEDEDEEDDGHDAMNYVSCLADTMTVETTLTGFGGTPYKIDLTDKKIRPAQWDLYQQDPDALAFLGEEDLKEAMQPFAAVLVKCDPKTGNVTRVRGDASKYGPDPASVFAALLPEASVRVEEKDGRHFYIDGKGCEYFFLGALPIEAIRFGRISQGWFDAYPDRPGWLREWEKTI